MVLYRKYRPQTFQEVVGQKHIIQTLTNAIQGNSLAHAYLFAGPRGTGKTTIARILARAVNCSSPQGMEPCNKCGVCVEILKSSSLDLVEIDAASNRGIEEIRLLREQTKLKPIRAKYKVFIIDEVHMLTREAFNALLKTLEEPPREVLFILATTEVHKVPETILSRVQRFNFKLLTNLELKKYLERIITQEGIALEEEVIDFILTRAQGSARDLATLLEQIITLQESNPREVKNFFGILDREKIHKFILHLRQGRGKRSLELLYSLCEEGISLDNFIEQILEILQRSLKEKLRRVAIQEQILGEFKLKDILKFIDIFLEAKNNTLAANIFPTLPLEIAIAKICQNRTEQEKEGDLSVNKESNLVLKKKGEVSIREESSQSVQESSLEDIKTQWSKILKELKAVNSGFATCLNFAQPVEYKKGKLTIAFQHSFHYQYITQKDKQRLLEKKIKEILGKDIILKAILREESQGPLTKKALEIFGGEVVS